MKLRVSDNGRFLVWGDGTPFFYLADTAWELFHRLNREEADYYLQTRAAQGFTVIQAVVLAEEDGLNDPNPYGERPLHENDPTQPNEKYFEHVDFIVNRAAELGLTIGMLPTWGDKWSRRHGVGPEIFTPENAEVYGEFLGRRYKESPIIWIVGGDRAIETPVHREINERMVAGLKAGDGGEHLITFHPCGQQSSSQYFHEADWLDFNMWQTGHRRGRDNYNSIASDYAKTPSKPCLDGEPGYENIPSDLQVGQPVLKAEDIRNSLYWALFAGAHGHTYGCNEVWQCWQPGRKGHFTPTMTWREALELPGASQMQHARKLLESRPFLTRISDQSLILEGQSDGVNHLQATRCENGQFAFIYFPSSVTAVIDLTLLQGNSIVSHWFNPRDGNLTFNRSIHGENSAEFKPVEGEGDWVLVLDAVET